VPNEEDPTQSYVVQWYNGGSACDLHDDWLVKPTASELPLVQGVQFVQHTWRHLKTAFGRLATILYRKALGMPPLAEPRAASQLKAALHRLGSLPEVGQNRPKRSVEVRYVCPRGALLEAGSLRPAGGQLPSGGRRGSALFLETRPDGSVAVAATSEGEVLRAGDTDPKAESAEAAYQDVVRLRSVREVAMCRYRMIVEMTSLCFHPAFAAKDTATGEPVLPGSARARAVCVADTGSAGHGDGVVGSGAVAFGGWNMPVIARSTQDN
jgi:hypothetical protein